MTITGNGAGAFGRRGRLPKRLVCLGLDHSAPVLGAWIVLALFATPGVFRLEIETSTKSVLDTSSSEWTYYQQAQDRFGGDEIITVLLQASQPLDEALLADVRRLSDDLAAIPGVSRVDSLRTVPNVRVDSDGRVSLDPILGPATGESVELLEARIRSDRIAPRLLISDDLRAAAINLVLEKDSDHLYQEVLSAVEHAVGPRRSSVSGVPVFRVAADTRTRSELLTFVPLTILLVGALLLCIFRSLVAASIPLATTGLATWIVMGVMGFQGIPVTITTVALPSVLLALGCAYSIHLTYAAATSERERLRDALCAVALPVTLSGLTTAVGFVAVSLVRIEVVRHMGTYGAFGVLLVLLATLTAGPAALRLRPPKLHTGFNRFLSERAAGTIVNVVSRRRTVVLAAWLAALAVAATGLSRLNVETDVIVWFDADDPIRRAYEDIKSRLVGISPMNVVVESPDASVAEPHVIDAIDRLARHLQNLESVGRSIAISDALRQIHGGFADNESQPLPMDRSLIEQYLLLLESKDYTNDLITMDRQAANIVLRINNNGSRALLDVAEAAASWWEQNGPSGYEARTTGIMYEFARAEDEIAWGQIRGLSFALLTIAMLLLLTFRSMILATLALIPNAVPIAMMFGFMGLLEYPIDAATVIVGNLALGIAVDDTIHLTEGFARRQAAGATPEVALRGALSQILAPVIYTSVAVAFGFATLAVSDFGPVRHLGVITGGVMLLCLLADLLMLPALLVRAAPSRM